MRRILAIIWGSCVLVLGAAWILYWLIGPRVFRERAGSGGIVLAAMIAAGFLLPLGVATVTAGVRTLRNLVRRE
jgi:threonine/homoserine efflux transporter RhtA